MDTLRRLAGRASEGVGMLVAGVFLLAQFGLFIGGISYRKDCMTPEGAVKQEWTFTWFAPVPYLFRPSENGCVIHTGTRVALNTAGIATFAETTPSLVAAKIADASSDSSAGYVTVVAAATAEYSKAAREAQTLDDGLASVDAFVGKLKQAPPPERYEAAHRRVLDALAAGRRDIEDLRSALEAANDSEAKRIARRSDKHTHDLQAAVQEIDRLRKTE
jgi:hypothetical protein